LPTPLVTAFPPYGETAAMLEVFCVADLTFAGRLANWRQVAKL
jgi:hypothetical protein